MKYIECYYGQSGSGKSESAAAVIKRIFEETGKTARILIGDGSGATYEGLVEAGVAQMTDYTMRDWPLSTLTDLCQGYWPADPEDPKSKLIAPKPEDFARIGITVIEGLSVAGAYVMGDKKGAFAWRGARGEKIGQDSPVMLADIERDSNGMPIKNSGPGQVFGGNPLAHFQHAQKRVLGFVEHSKGLPGWVIWTAHEKASEDKITSAKLVGPEVAGGALTSTVSRHFNNTLHFQTASSNKKVKDEHTQKMIDVPDTQFRIYTRDHFQAEGSGFIKYKAVTRHSDPRGNKYGSTPLRDYYASDVPGKALVDIYESIKEAREREKRTLAKAA